VEFNAPVFPLLGIVAEQCALDACRISWEVVLGNPFADLSIRSPNLAAEFGAASLALLY
jgi:hypothetical protein